MNLLIIGTDVKTGDNVSNPWIKLSKNGNAALTMFCFPYSGGSSSVFRPFADALPPDIDVYALEMPGRGRRFREDIKDSLLSMVDEAVENILSLQNRGRFIFFGHSLGALIAFETARELRHRDLPLPKHLFVSGARAPHIPKREKFSHDMPFDAFVDRLKLMGGTHGELLENQEMLELMIPILRKDFRMYELYDYKSEKPLKCPITAFGGNTDEYIRSDDVEGWKEHTSILFSSHMLEGGHFFINTHGQDVIDIILKKLALQRL